jgi:Zn-dependent protease with chaperone function
VNVVFLLLPLGAVFVIVFAVMGALVRAILAARIVRPHRWLSSSVVVSLASLPIVMATLSVIALVVPNPLGTCHCVAHGAHHPHLCVFHSELARPLLGAALAVIATWALLCAPRVKRLFAQWLETVRLGRSVRRVPADLVDGIPVRLLDLATPQIFSVGMLRPLVVADRKLWSALSRDERRAVAHHEHAHAERLDGFTLFTLRAWSALCPFPLGNELIQAWRRCAERACDSHAARVLADAASVAQALITVERARAAVDNPSTPALSLGVVGHSDLEGRVRALLDEPRSAPALANDVLAVAVLATGAAIFTAVWPGTILHHTIETAFGLIVH